MENEITIKRIFARYFRRTEDIEELTQETFLKCFVAEMKEDIRSPKAFLLRVAKNLALSEIKKKVNTTTDYLEDFGGSGVLVDERHISAEDRIDSQQKLFVFSKAIASLSPDQRRALLMRKLEKLKIKQIASRLDVSVSTVEKRIAAALVNCNAYMREQGFDPAEFDAVLGRGSGTFAILSQDAANNIAS